MYRVKKCNAQRYLNKKKDKCLVVFSDSSIKYLKLKDNFIRLNINSTDKNIYKIQSFLNNNYNFKEIISIGGGTAIDIGKYIAYLTKRKLSVILTMLSTNAFATDKVCLNGKIKKTTMQAVCPNVVIFDENLLKFAKEYNNFGLCDVLSIHTALRDWEISNIYTGEKINKYYKKSKSLYLKTKRHILKNINNLDNCLWKSFKYIKLSGIITNKHGSGRPESGSEHIYAREIELKKEKIIHGLAVINGIMVMSVRQNNLDDDIQKIYNYFCIDMYNKKYKITKKLLKDINNNIQPRSDRFTIINLK